jgi:hypothetical protein
VVQLKKVLVNLLNQCTHYGTQISRILVDRWGGVLQKNIVTIQLVLLSIVMGTDFIGFSQIKAADFGLSH